VGESARLGEIEALYRARFPHFKRVALAIVGDPERAVDAVHDGFADAIRSRAGFRGEGSLEAWVWRAVVNAALRLRRPVHELELSDGVFSSNGHMDDSASEVVRAAIGELPERQRLVLFLRYYADLDYHGIASALDVRPGTIGATLHAAHATLRAVLDEQEANLDR
jgi:RNA polymerase sigma factor (sigma-70 family)